MAIKLAREMVDMMNNVGNVSDEQPAAIDQLNLGFDVDQDRLLFKVGFSDNTELVLWLTRRITKSIWSWLKTSQEVLLDEPVQVFTMNAQGSLEEAMPKIISALKTREPIATESIQPEVDLKNEYRANRTPRLPTPMLIVSCRVVTDGPTQFVLEFGARNGQKANVVLSLELKIAFTNMLQLACKEAAWDLTAPSSHFIAPQSNAAQVLH
jgi:hypothetical protein